jgi:hypothetical protein
LPLADLPENLTGMENASETPEAQGGRPDGEPSERVFYPGNPYGVDIEIPNTGLPAIQ